MSRLLTPPPLLPNHLGPEWPITISGRTILSGLRIGQVKAADKKTYKPRNYFSANMDIRYIRLSFLTRFNRQTPLPCRKKKPF